MHKLLQGHREQRDSPAEAADPIEGTDEVDVIERSQRRVPEGHPETTTSATVQVARLTRSSVAPRRRSTSRPPPCKGTDTIRAEIHGKGRSPASQTQEGGQQQADADGQPDRRQPGLKTALSDAGTRGAAAEQQLGPMLLEVDHQHNARRDDRDDRCPADRIVSLVGDVRDDVRRMDDRLRAVEIAFGKVDQRLATLERLHLPTSTAPGPAD